MATITAIESMTSGFNYANAGHVVNLINNRIAPKIDEYIDATEVFKGIFSSGEDMEFKGERSLQFNYRIQDVESWAPHLEMEVMPAPGEMKYGTFHMFLRKFVGRFGASQETLLLNKGEYAFWSGLKEMMESFLRARARHYEAYLSGNGSGVFGQATGAATGQVIPINWPHNVNRGQLITGVDADGNVDMQPGMVASMDQDYQAHTKTITMSAGVDVSSVDANTYFYIAQAYTPSYNKAMMGLAGHLSDVNPPEGSYQGGDRDTNTHLRAIAHYGGTPGTNEALTVARLRAMMGDFKNDPRNRKMPDVGLMSPGVFTPFADLLEASGEMHYNKVGKTLGFPHKSVAFVHNGQEVRLEEHLGMVDNTIYFVTPSKLIRYKGPRGWFAAGADKLRPMMDHLGFVGDYYEFENTGCKNLGAQGVMFDITSNWS